MLILGGIIRLLLLYSKHASKRINIIIVKYALLYKEFDTDNTYKNQYIYVSKLSNSNLNNLKTILSYNMQFLIYIVCLQLFVFLYCHLTYSHTKVCLYIFVLTFGLIKKTYL